MPLRKRAKPKIRAKKKDPIFIDGERPRPLFVDYKDLELLNKLTNRQGKIVSRRKSGCKATRQPPAGGAYNFHSQERNWTAQ